MLHENDVVRLKHNIPANNPTEWPGIPSTALDTGTIGSVVMVYTTDSINYEYEIEFVDDDGYTLALLTLNENDVELVNTNLRLIEGQGLPPNQTQDRKRALHQQGKSEMSATERRLA